MPVTKKFFSISVNNNVNLTFLIKFLLSLVKLLSNLEYTVNNFE